MLHGARRIPPGFGPSAAVSVLPHSTHGHVVVTGLTGHLVPATFEQQVRHETTLRDGSGAFGARENPVVAARFVLSQCPSFDGSRAATEAAGH